MAGDVPVVLLDYGFGVGTVTVQYKSNATYKIAFTVAAANGTATTGANVAVKVPPPSVSINYDATRSLPSSGSDGSAVVDFSFQTFTAVTKLGAPNNAVSAITKFTINWGDGTQDDMTADVAPDGNGNYASYTGHWYPSSGNFVATATVVDAFGQSTSAQATIVWQYQYQNPAVTFKPVTVVDETVVIQGSVQQVDYWYRVTKLQLDWGDGTTTDIPFIPNSQWGSSITFIGTHVYPAQQSSFVTATLLVTSAYATTKASVNVWLPYVVFRFALGGWKPPVVVPPVIVGPGFLN